MLNILFQPQQQPPKKEEERGDVIKKLVDDYIARHPCEFLNATKCCNDDDTKEQLNLKQYWLKTLTLKKSNFMKGWKPTTSQYDSLYDQLFYRYFEHPTETERYISKLSDHHPLIWIPPNWFEHTEPLPSGRMGQVYLSQCRFPWRTKKLIVREINLCLALNGKLHSCPNEIIGITAIRSSDQQSCCRKLALVSIAAKSTLEQLIPQADQWSFQKLYRTALLLSSSIRDSPNLLHPNLQPNNIMLYEDAQHFTIIDDWPSIPTCSTYGRYPYIAPELYSGQPDITERSMMYALGIMLWQLASGIIFPQSLPIPLSIYGIGPLAHVDPAYQNIIIQCLQKDPQKRPSSFHAICDALVRILTTELACPSPPILYQQHINAIQQSQSVVLKYLASHHASKRDIQNVLYGASITRRMRVHVTLSLDPLFHPWHPKKEKKITSPPPRRRLSEDRDESRKKKIYTMEPASCSLYGADLPELMQMGFA